MKDYQNILLPYAYNILGSTDDAKDVVQDVITNYVRSKSNHVVNEKGYLIKSVVNQSISLKTKQKTIRYDDVRLPEPIATENADEELNLKEIISYSLMILLEKLNPKERAVFILKEAFGYSHADIAEVLSSTVEHSRKLLSRAKLKLRESKTDNSLLVKNSVPTEHLHQYIELIRSRDVEALENFLAEDIIISSDGGKEFKVVRKLIKGKPLASRFLMYVYHKFQKSLTSKFSEVNHQPAILYYKDDNLVICQIIGINREDLKIKQVNTIVDPEKLRNINLALQFE